MKAESNLKPENKFEIENIINGKCELVFFDNIQELESTEEGEKRYLYDIFRLKTNYRDELEKELIDDSKKYSEWLELARNTEYNELASQIREKRNELLKESDQFMCLDRMGIEIPGEEITITTVVKIAVAFFKNIFDVLKGQHAKYRQELRDLTKQPGFPYDVTWPTKDKEE